MDLFDLVVERMVVHRVPQREPKATAEQQEPLSLSEAVSPLDADGDRLRVYMLMRLRGSLQSMDKAFDVVFDAASPSPIPARIRAFLAEQATGVGTTEERDDALVDLSGAMAECLFEVQGPQPPTGLLAVVSGTLGGRPMVSVMKLEHERGVTVDEKTIGGRKTFTMTVADDLVLTQGTKVFKAAIFNTLPGQAPTTAPDDLECAARVSDTQATFQASSIAAYYTHKFLGVRLSDAPRVTTERVFKAIEEFINDGITDPARSVSAARALLVEMAANKSTFSAQVFGNHHLQAPERQALKAHLQQQGLPTQGFPKDTELIAGHLRMLSVELDGRITVTAPEDQFDGEVIAVDSSDGDANTTVTIKAGLRRTKSRGR